MSPTSRLAGKPFFPGEYSVSIVHLERCQGVSGVRSWTLPTVGFAVPGASQEAGRKRHAGKLRSPKGKRQKMRIDEGVDFQDPG